METWIECIGSNLGLLTSSSFRISETAYFILLCVHENNNIIYSPYGYCYHYEGLETINKYDNRIKIYPTIVNDIINIETKNHKKLKVKVVDVLGNVIIETKIRNNTINCNNITKGVYQCLFFDDENNIISVNIFIKQ